MRRRSLLTRTDQKLLSLAAESLWNCIPGLAGFSWRSKAVVLAAFCSSTVRRVRQSMNESGDEELHQLPTEIDTPT